MHYVLIGLLAAAFPLLHIANGHLFHFAEISPHIGLVYLPAFLRLFNMLVLGPRDGTLATVLGGLLLMQHFDESPTVGLINVLCSASGPLVALGLFRLHFQRACELTSLKDLSILTLLYALANAVLHHTAWSLWEPQRLQSPTQMLWMTVGDVTGTLIGAYLMRFAIQRYRARQIDR